MPSERPPARLHPFSLVRGISIRELLQAVPAAVIAVSALGGIGSASGVVAVLVALAALRIVAYRRHTYELTEEAVVERRGILQRRERTLGLDRLQQVEVEQGLLDRLVGTAVVRLETASDAGASELELRVVSEAEAHRIRGALLGRAPQPDDRPAGEELVHVPLADVALAAITGPRLLAIPVVVGGLLGLLLDLDLVEESRAVLTDRLGAYGTGAIVLLALLGLVVSAVVAVAVGLLRDGDFRIRRVGDDLHVRRGLLATREAVVPVSRLQLVAVQRSLVRRALGYGSVTLHSAGGIAAQESLERQLTVPLLREAHLAPLALELLGDPGPWPVLEPHPPAARTRAVLRWWRRMGLVLVGLAVVLAQIGSLTVPRLAVGVAVAAAVATWLGVLEHRHLASGRGPRLVGARSGALSLTEAVAPVLKVQGTTVRTSPFQRRRGLATLEAHVAGPGRAIRMADLGVAAAVGHRAALERSGWRRSTEGAAAP